MAPSPNLIGEASITNTVSVGKVTPFIGFLLVADYNRRSDPTAARRPWPPAGHEIRGASASRLPPLLRARAAQRDCRQPRARHQLLGHLPGVSFADARRVRRHQPLGAVPALLGVRGLINQTIRLPQADPDLAGTLRAG